MKARQSDRLCAGVTGGEWLEDRRVPSGLLGSLGLAPLVARSLPLVEPPTPGLAETAAAVAPSSAVGEALASIVGPAVAAADAVVEAAAAAIPAAPAITAVDVIVEQAAVVAIRPIEAAIDALDPVVARVDALISPPPSTDGSAPGAGGAGGAPGPVVEPGSGPSTPAAPGPGGMTGPVAAGPAGGVASGNGGGSGPAPSAPPSTSGAGPASPVGPGPGSQAGGVVEPPKNGGTPPAAPTPTPGQATPVQVDPIGPKLAKAAPAPGTGDSSARSSQPSAAHPGTADGIDGPIPSLGQLPPASATARPSAPGGQPGLIATTSAVASGRRTATGPSRDALKSPAIPGPEQPDGPSAIGPPVGLGSGEDRGALALEPAELDVDGMAPLERALRQLIGEIEGLGREAGVQLEGFLSSPETYMPVVGSVVLAILGARTLGGARDPRLRDGEGATPWPMEILSYD